MNLSFKLRYDFLNRPCLEFCTTCGNTLYLKDRKVIERRDSLIQSLICSKCGTEHEFGVTKLVKVWPNCMDTKIKHTCLGKIKSKQELEI